MTKEKIICPKCGTEAETLHYVPIDGKHDNEVFLIHCPKCKHHSKEWHLTKGEAIQDFHGVKNEENFAIIPLGCSCVGCELYAKIPGNPELIPYKKDTLTDFLTSAFKKNVKVKIQVPTKSKVENAFTVIESFFNEYVGEEGRMNLFNAFLQFRKDTGGGQDESGRND